MIDTPKRIDELLFDAIHTHSMRTRGQPAERVTIQYPDGSEATYPIPARAVTASSWPPSEGWAFRPGEASFNGVRVRLCGKLLAILRALAERPGEPVTAEKLKRSVWGEEPDLVEDGNVQGHISLLRKKLRESLELDKASNPVSFADGAYRLTVY